MIVQLVSQSLLGYLVIAEALRRQKEKKIIKYPQIYVIGYFRRASTSVGEPACV